MHILFVSDNFPPEVNAPSNRTFEHCKQWVKAGAKVTVVTGVPNFPSGKVFKGYRNKLWQTEKINDIDVFRVWTFIYPNKGFIGRIIDYMSFMGTSFLISFFIKKVDIVVGTSPQFFTVCSARMIGLCKRIPWIFELRDLWPDSIVAVGAMRKRKIFYLLKKIEYSLYRSSSAIVAVTETFKDHLVRTGVDGNKISVVKNGVDVSTVIKSSDSLRLKRQLGIEGKFIVGYIGTLGLAHGLDTLVWAAKMLQNDSSAKDIKILIMGDGAEKLTLSSLAKKFNLRNILFVDTVPRNVVFEYISMLDLGVVHLKNQTIFRGVIPSKIFEYMAIGIPILHGVPGESADIIISERSGITFEPENPKDLCEKILFLKNSPKQLKEFSRFCFEGARKYDRRVLAIKMLRVMQEIVEK